MSQDADQYCVMGNPVAHSKSPWIHARFAALTGQHIEYGRRLIPMDGFVAALQAFQAEGGKGCNITVPFKFEAATMLSRRSARAALAGACNTLRFDGGFVVGDNTDGVGLVADIQRNAGVALAGTDVLLVGAGGAAAGVLGPIIDARPRQVTIVNRTPEKARKLVVSHTALAEASGVALSCAGLEDVGGAFDVVVNATASSLNGGGIPVAATVLKPGGLAYDMMYGPAARDFLAWAGAHGAVARDGLGMLVEQAAEAFHVFRGVRPPSAQVLAELRAEMAA
ncbi:shikimate dehydrogenase [Caenimonas sedimenti]|uniref:Shikimate dehydrogenase (NADP(+)) n=1 Tax=Caenimonas sedimenti TaxID=2596921 RepID=A0A562ZU08_9BURK|nr:shikimate dehydrogenase [Caenimonas sedimenti]TWO72092.1 shikimate dehydrogenase [Caenimonas sedimenti]